MKQRLLLPSRQKRILRGLSSRQEKSRAHLQKQLEELQLKKQETDASWKAKIEGEDLQGKKRISNFITEWDETLERTASEIESKTLSSLQREKEQRKLVQQEHNSKIASIQKQFEASVQEADNLFAKHKDDPKHIYDRHMAELETTLKPSAQAVVEARELARVRGLTIQHYPASEQSVSVHSMHDATEHLGRLHAHLHRCADKLKTHIVVRILEGFGLWAIAILVAIIAGIATYFATQANILYSGGAFVGGAVVTTLLLILILRGPLKKLTSKYYPEIEATWSSSQKVLQAAQHFVLKEAESELNALKYQHAESLALAERTKIQNHAATEKATEQKLKDIADQARTLRETLANQWRQSDQQIKEKCTPHHQQQQLELTRLLKELIANRQKVLDEFEAKSERLAIRTRDRLSTGWKSVERLANESFSWLESNYPKWEDASWSNDKWNRPATEPVFPLGKLLISLPPESASANTNQPDDREHHAQLPLTFQPLLHGGISLQTPSRLVPETDAVIRNVVLRALTSLPAGKLRLTIIDPRGLGRDYSWLMHLADFDPKLVTHRVWTEPAHIAQQLGDAVRQSEQVIQQLLRDRFANLHEYNAQAGTMAEPYRMILWPNFPFGCDEITWKHIASLLQAGPRCGVIVCLQCDEGQSWPPYIERDLIERCSLSLRFSERDEPTGNQHGGNYQVRWQEKELDQCELMLDPPPPELLQHHLLTSAGTMAVLAGRVEVPLKELLPNRDQWWQQSSDLKLEIPIGQAGPGRSQALKLGVGTAQHALIAGKTGSGKSTLLHTLITSAAIRYSPDELRMILLDFKKGVEFQIYAENQLPHADIIGIESQREFGLSSLEFLDRCMQQRGERFRDAGVQDLAGWARVKPDQPMPRVLLVIDEFQELFVQDDKLAQQASLLLDRVVRQGRSFGVHAILASQTLAGAYSLPRTTLGQMGIRIALQCDPADATVILGDDNLAASRLSYPGQAIYNDAGGRVEGNQAFQVAWVDSQTQANWFGQLDMQTINRDTSTNSLGRQVIFDGHRPSEWDSIALDRAIVQFQATQGIHGRGMIVGDSVAIRPATSIVTPRQAGRNVLMVGNDSNLATRVIGTSFASNLRSSKKGNRKPDRVVVLNGSRPNDVPSSELVEWLRQLPTEVEVVDVRQSDDALRRLATTLTERQENENSEENIWLVLLQLDRFRNLRKSDDFGFGSDAGESSDKILASILRDGPAVGIHNWIWADSHTTVTRWLSRSTMNDLEIRILMQMSNSDSNHLIDSAAASHLGAQLLMINDDASGQSERFRPIMLPSAELTRQWIES